MKQKARQSGLFARKGIVRQCEAPDYFYTIKTIHGFKCKSSIDNFMVGFMNFSPQTERGEESEESTFSLRLFPTALANASERCDRIAHTLFERAAKGSRTFRQSIGRP